MRSDHCLDPSTILEFDGVKTMSFVGLRLSVMSRTQLRMLLDLRTPIVSSVVIDPLTVSDNGEFSPETIGVEPDALIVYMVLACVGAAAHGAPTRAVISARAKRCEVFGSPYFIRLSLLVAAILVLDEQQF